MHGHRGFVRSARVVQPPVAKRGDQGDGQRLRLFLCPIRSCPLHLHELISSHSRSWRSLRMNPIPLRRPLRSERLLLCVRLTLRFDEALAVELLEVLAGVLLRFEGAGESLALGFIPLGEFSDDGLLDHLVRRGLIGEDEEDELERGGNGVSREARQPLRTHRRLRRALARILVDELRELCDVECPRGVGVIRGNCGADARDLA
mmetsp:Transcript_22209/g.71994  ORF Transcript_22209/g.71994 Transcript_22209/m.71994 type:complete len:204 (+) Transcript_22209:1249-1860(+)